MDKVDPLLLATARALKAERLFGAVRPAIAVEVGPKDASDVSDVFHRHRYRLFDDPAGLKNEQSVETPVWNTIALPEEK